MELRTHALRLHVVEVEERRFDARLLDHRVGHRLDRGLVVVSVHALQPTDAT